LHPAESFNYCSVPLTGQDAFLFVGIALLVAALVVGKLAPVWTLLAGALCLPAYGGVWHATGQP
jgi:hypothetical protein